MESSKAGAIAGKAAEFGDWVVHLTHGTGQIVAVKEKQFSGKGASLYYEVALPRVLTQ